MGVSASSLLDEAKSAYITGKNRSVQGKQSSALFGFSSRPARLLASFLPSRFSAEEVSSGRSTRPGGVEEQTRLPGASLPGSSGYLSGSGAPGSGEERSGALGVSAENNRLQETELQVLLHLLHLHRLQVFLFGCEAAGTAGEAVRFGKCDPVRPEPAAALILTQL